MVYAEWKKRRQERNVKHELHFAAIYENKDDDSEMALSGRQNAVSRLPHKNFQNEQKTICIYQKKKSQTRQQNSPFANCTTQ
jgi:hypothetical protein